ncbi:MAG: pyruvate dehydrogenase (acetyl-transferring) E1 component subunit alpha, partial [Bacteroidetes bacterium]
LHESFNLAMLWKLPVIYIIENNNYAMGTSVERTSNVTELYKLGLSYDMPSKPVDGMSVLTVYEEMKAAIDYVRAGNGPMLIEMKTYRYRGHSMSDPAKYRTREELEKYKGKDPIANLKIYLQEQNTATEEEMSVIDERIHELVEASVTFAEESPFPDTSALYEDIYVGEYPFLME